MTTAELTAFLSDTMSDFVTAWFSKVKARAGYADSVTAFDTEISDLMEAAVTDMLTGGVPEALFVTEAPIDKRILDAIASYVNAKIEHDRRDTLMYMDLYHQNVRKLSLEDGGAWDVDNDD